MNSERMDELRKRLVLMNGLGYANAIGPPALVVERITTQPIRHQHDWGVWGRYEYLGPGTPATRKYEAGVKPKNRIDQIAMKHDLDYVEANRLYDKETGEGDWVAMYGTKVRADFMAGSAMVVSSVDPTADLSFGERFLSFGAGAGLLIQSGARVHPVTAPWMVVVDWLFY